MMDTGANVDEVAAEMRRRWGFRPREAYRHAHGWSQDEAAVRFTGIAGRLGTSPASSPASLASADRSSVSMVGTRIGEYERWPHGGRRPSPYVLTVLAEVYGTTVDALLDAADLAELPEQERTVLAAVSTGRPAASRPRRPAAPAASVVPPAPPALPARAPVSRATTADVRVLLRERARAAAAVSQRLAPVAETTLTEVPSAWTGAAVPYLTEGGTPREREARRAATLDRARRDADPAGLVAASAAEAAEFAEWAGVAQVGPSTIEQLHHDVRVLARDFLTHPPVPVLHRALRLRNRVFSLLERRQRPGQARELFLVGGRLCGIAAWIAGDLGYPAEAGTHARTAWLCAELAESGNLQGWVRATQSKLAYWAGNPRDSAMLAEQGLELGVRDSGRAMLAGLAARGWARHGDELAAQRALRLLDAERGTVDAENEVGGILACSEAQVEYLSGTTYRFLGDPGRAVTAADRAVWLFEVADPRERFYGAESLAQLDAAIVTVTLGDLDGTAARLAHVLALAPAKRTDLILRRADDLEQMLRGTGEPARSSAGRLADELADFRAAG